MYLFQELYVLTHAGNWMFAIVSIKFVSLAVTKLAIFLLYKLAALGN